jgi:hypothetical protein
MLEYSIVGSLSVQANVQVREQDLGLVANYYKSVEPWFTSQRTHRVYRTFISYWDPSSESLALHCLATGDTNLNKFWGKIRYDDSKGTDGWGSSCPRLIFWLTVIQLSRPHNMKVIFRFLGAASLCVITHLVFFSPLLNGVASGLHTPEYLQLNLPKRHFVTHPTTPEPPEPTRSS